MRRCQYAPAGTYGHECDEYDAIAAWNRIQLTPREE